MTNGSEADFEIKRVDTDVDMSGSFQRSNTKKYAGAYAWRGDNAKDDVYTWGYLTSPNVITDEGVIEIWGNAGDQFGSNKMVVGCAFGLLSGSIAGYQEGIIAYFDESSDKFGLGYLNDTTKLPNRSYGEADISLTQYEWYKVWLRFSKLGSNWDVEARLYDSSLDKLATLTDTVGGSDVGTRPGWFEMTNGQYSYIDEFRVWDYS